MKNKFISSVFVALCCAAAVFAQTTKSNFAGEWELDLAKSTLPETMRVEAMTLKVAQTDKELTVQSAAKRARGVRGMEPLATYTLDGKEAVKETGSGVMAVKDARRATLTADGKLNLTLTRLSNSGVMLKTNEIWELLDQGNTLKITRYLETPRGATNAEMIFTRRMAGGINVVPAAESPEAMMNVEPTAASSINGGVLNGKARNLVKPAYPPAARAVKASGAVNVQVTIDEQGSVISASAISGHPLLRQAAEEAARASTFAPTLLEGQPVKVTGVIVYNFVP